LTPRLERWRGLVVPSNGLPTGPGSNGPDMTPDIPLGPRDADSPPEDAGQEKGGLDFIIVLICLACLLYQVLFTTQWRQSIDTQWIQFRRLSCNNFWRFLWCLLRLFWISVQDLLWTIVHIFTLLFVVINILALVKYFVGSSSDLPPRDFEDLPPPVPPPPVG
jgi:hypothetical protein